MTSGVGSAGTKRPGIIHVNAGPFSFLIGRVASLFLEPLLMACRTDRRIVALVIDPRTDYEFAAIRAYFRRLERHLRGTRDT